jgi:hypothetical protein
MTSAASHFALVQLAHASRLINHGPTVLVTSAHGGRRNVMAAAWSMPVEFTPPRIAIVIDKKTYHARAGRRQRRVRHLPARHRAGGPDVCRGQHQRAR